MVNIITRKKGGHKKEVKEGKTPFYAYTFTQQIFIRFLNF